MSHPPERQPADSSVPNGLAALPQACRAFLREALAAGGTPLAEHATGCATCAARVAAAARLRAAMRTAVPVPAVSAPAVSAPAVPVPAALGSRAMLERVQEQIVAAAEASPLGAALAQAWTIVPAPGRQVEAADLSTGTLAAPLRRRLATPPPAVPPLAWGKMQASIVGRVRAEAVARRRVWPFGAAAGAAAAAVLLLLLLRDQPVRPPEIVFMDLAAPPNVDFAILRYGPPK